MAAGWKWRQRRSDYYTPLQHDLKDLHLSTSALGLVLQFIHLFRQEGERRQTHYKKVGNLREGSVIEEFPKFIQNNLS